MVIGFAMALLVACGDSDADSVTDRGTPAAEVGRLAIYEPYVPAAPADIAALYFVVANEGDQVDRLIKISSDAAGMAMLHQTVVDGDSSRMTLVEGGLEIPPGGEAVLAPGGYHVMLMNLVERLAVGDSVSVTLEFEGAGVVMIDVPVIDGIGGAMEDMLDDE